MKVATAVRRMIRQLDGAGPGAEALGAVAVKLAVVMDDPGTAPYVLPNAARELRAVIAAMAPDAGPADAELEALLRDVQR